MILPPLHVTRRDTLTHWANAIHVTLNPYAWPMTAITDTRKGQVGRKRIFNERHLFGVRLEEPDANRFIEAAAQAGQTHQEFLFAVVKERLAQQQRSTA